MIDHKVTLRVHTTGVWLMDIGVIKAPEQLEDEEILVGVITDKRSPLFSEWWIVYRKDDPTYTVAIPRSAVVSVKVYHVAATTSE